MESVGIAATVIAVGAMAAVFGIILAIAAQKFAVKVDPRIKNISEVLPGANCGGCGYPGCAGYAAAIVETGAAINLCAPGGGEVASSIAEIMGVEAESSEPRVAVVKCRGGCSVAAEKFEYDGISDCRAAALVNTGAKGCRYGCLGLGSCVAACPFGAIIMTEDDIPLVLEEKCVGCGKCVEVCPRDVISLVPRSKPVVALCQSQLRGAAAKKLCKVACISCKKCEKECKFDAIHIVNNIPVIDYDKCTSCGKCVLVCPQNVIVNLRPVRKKMQKQHVDGGGKKAKEEAA